MCVGGWRTTGEGVAKHVACKGQRLQDARRQFTKDCLGMLYCTRGMQGNRSFCLEVSLSYGCVDQAFF